jgi:hypothetical protein
LSVVRVVNDARVGVLIGDDDWVDGDQAGVKEGNGRSLAVTGCVVIKVVAICRFALALDLGFIRVVDWVRCALHKKRQLV